MITELTIEVPIVVRWREDTLIPENKKITDIENWSIDREKFEEMYPDEKIIEMIKEAESEY